MRRGGTGGAFAGPAPRLAATRWCGCRACATRPGSPRDMPRREVRAAPDVPVGPGDRRRVGAGGLLAGLYRGRWQRGSLDEVVSVTIAGGLMLASLCVVWGSCERPAGRQRPARHRSPGTRADRGRGCAHRAADDRRRALRAVRRAAAAPDAGAGAGSRSSCSGPGRRAPR